MKLKHVIYNIDGVKVTVQLEGSGDPKDQHTILGVSVEGEHGIFTFGEDTDTNKERR